MVENPGNTNNPAKIPSPRRRFDMRELSRVGTWGLAALGALTLAAYAASSEIGENRLILAVASVRGVPPPERLAQRPDEIPTRQLASAIRELSAEREQLTARLDTLERTMGDVTSSIAKVAAAPAIPMAPMPSPPPPVIATPEAIAAITAPVMPDLTTPRSQPAATATEEPSHPRTDSKPEFGIDLGRASSVEGLRQLWAAARTKHGPALEGLRPIVAVREIPRTAGVELRLVAGPLPNAAAAARACAQLQGATCHPTVFEGQRLALR